MKTSWKNAVITSCVCVSVRGDTLLLSSVRIFLIETFKFPRNLKQLFLFIFYFAPLHLPIAPPVSPFSKDKAEMKNKIKIGMLGGKIECWKALIVPYLNMKPY